MISVRVDMEYRSRLQSTCAWRIPNSLAFLGFRSPVTMALRDLPIIVRMAAQAMRLAFERLAAFCQRHSGIRDDRQDACPVSPTYDVIEYVTAAERTRSTMMSQQKRRAVQKTLTLAGLVLVLTGTSPAANEDRDE
jgi:hypothetical protein